MDFMNQITDNALILIPVLNLIGMFIKNTKKINTAYIPFILLILGVGGAVALLGWSGESIVQGILVTGTAVYGHQMVTQYKNITASNDSGSDGNAPGANQSDVNKQ